MCGARCGAWAQLALIWGAFCHFKMTSPHSLDFSICNSRHFSKIRVMIYWCFFLQCEVFCLFRGLVTVLDRGVVNVSTKGGNQKYHFLISTFLAVLQSWPKNSSPPSCISHVYLWKTSGEWGADGLSCFGGSMPGFEACLWYLIAIWIGECTTRSIPGAAGNPVPVLRGIPTPSVLSERSSS